MHGKCLWGLQIALSLRSGRRVFRIASKSG